MMTIDICEYKNSDALDHYHAVINSIDRLKPWFSWASENYKLTNSRQFIRDQDIRKNNGFYDFKIANHETGEFLGNCSLRVFNRPGETIASMNYWKKSGLKKINFMPEALNTLVAFAFYDLNIDIIEIDVDSSNYPSLKLIESLGALPNKDIIFKNPFGETVSGKRFIIKNNDHKS